MLKRAEKWQDFKYMSQSYLSKLLGYSSPQTISNIERGLMTIPVEKIREYSEALDIPTEDILEAVVDDFRNNLYEKLKKDDMKKTKEEMH